MHNFRRRSASYSFTRPPGPRSWGGETSAPPPARLTGTTPATADGAPADPRPGVGGAAGGAEGGSRDPPSRGRALPAQGRRLASGGTEARRGCPGAGGAAGGAGLGGSRGGGHRGRRGATAGRALPRTRRPRAKRAGWPSPWARRAGHALKCGAEPSAASSALRDIAYAWRGPAGCRPRRREWKKRRRSRHSPSRRARRRRRPDRAPRSVGSGAHRPPPRPVQRRPSRGSALCKARVRLPRPSAGGASGGGFGGCGGGRPLRRTPPHLLPPPPPRRRSQPGPRGLPRPPGPLQRPRRLSRRPRRKLRRVQ